MGGMAGAARVSPPLSFKSIYELVQQATISKVLPTAVLVTTEEETEVKVLAFVVRHRDADFMVMLPALEPVRGILNTTFVNAEGASLVVYREIIVQLEDSRNRKFGLGKVFVADFGAECRRVLPPDSIIAGLSCSESL